VNSGRSEILLEATCSRAFSEFVESYLAFLLHESFVISYHGCSLKTEASEGKESFWGFLKSQKWELF
jgi:hypothetical protein